MPRDNPKELSRCEPIVQDKICEALAHPGKLIIVEADVSIRRSETLMYRLRSARKGFLVFEPPESERYLAAQNMRLRFNRTWHWAKPDIRTVTAIYEGRIQRPSEEAAKALADFHAGLRSSPF